MAWENCTSCSLYIADCYSRLPRPHYLQQPGMCQGLVAFQTFPLVYFIVANAHNFPQILWAYKRGLSNAKPPVATMSHLNLCRQTRVASLPVESGDLPPLQWGPRQQRSLIEKDCFGPSPLVLHSQISRGFPNRSWHPYILSALKKKKYCQTIGQILPPSCNYAPNYSAELVLFT